MMIYLIRGVAFRKTAAACVKDIGTLRSRGRGQRSGSGNA